MTTETPNDKDELYRLREENLRMREERLSAASRPTHLEVPTTVNVSQTNQSALAGCGGLIGLFIALTFILAKCGG